ncbi:hypothetical protein F5B22DRAFT_102040 [Xylaria bambusicola]|uniref:uncharacterized protein n=1 Tax=Xylaria bambusicola TaxID=326684 RepID=UPI002008418B|nr:uncharacterized protein F5B22DRAFT_102040 [Xylaria bambusicola]KAI0517843.1 hypothetical protein F5B22DRAFT_102040 [Xylaria bambusicola]
MLTTLDLAPSCVTETWLMTVGTEGGAAVVVGKPSDPSCWPGTRDLATTISPAICPEGYTSACDITDPSQKKPGETVWACCPSNFVCDGGTWQCLADQPGETKTYTVFDTNSNGDTITTKVTSDRGINAHSIRVAFRSSDIVGSPSSTTDTSVSRLAPTETATLSIPAPPSNTAPGSSSKSPSTGAWIGIGVAIGVSALVLLASLVWLVRRRSRKQQPSIPPQYVAQVPKPPNKSYVTQPSELNADPGPHELETKAAVPTLVNRL